MRKLLILLALAPAVARADKGKANVLLKTAEHALDEAGCFRGDRGDTGCGDDKVFPAALAKVDAALAEDASGETLRRACRIVEESQGPDFVWAVEHGWARRGIALCELVTVAEDLDTVARNAGPSGAQSIRTKLWQKRDEAANDADMVAAARALYGAGFKMKLDKASGQIALDWGEVDDARLQDFIAEYYLRYAGELRAGSDLTGVDAAALTHQRTFGWLLLEARAKLELCQKIAYNMAKSRKATEQWCGMQALIEAGSPLFAFRGKAASFDAKGQGGGLAPTDRAWAPSLDGRFAPALTVAGPVPLDDQAHIELVTRSGGEMVTSDSPYYQDALAQTARARKVYDARRDDARKNQDKLAGAGGMVIYSDGPFDRWDMPRILKAADKPACDKLNFGAFRRTANKGETLLLGIEVDGAHCWAANVDRTFEAVMAGASNRYGDNHCRQALQAPGEHVVSMTLHTYKVWKTGRKEITENGVIQDQFASDIDKKLGTWKASCTTQGGGKVESRYE